MTYLADISRSHACQEITHDKTDLDNKAHQMLLNLSRPGKEVEYGGYSMPSGSSCPISYILVLMN